MKLRLLAAIFCAIMLAGCGSAAPATHPAAPPATTVAILVASTAAPAASTATTVTAPSTPAPLAYSLKAGDTPDNVAARYGLTRATLDGLNPGLETRGLHVGDVIYLPAGAQLVPASAPTTAPVRVAAPPPGSTPSGPFIPYPGNGGGPTQCRDGTVSHSSGRGTCSHHGGEAR